MSKFDKYKKPESFYKAYDSILADPVSVATFLHYFREEFGEVSDKECAHKEVIKIFIKFFFTRCFANNPISQIFINQNKSVYTEMLEIAIKKNYGDISCERVEVFKTIDKLDGKAWKLFENIEKIEKENLGTGTSQEIFDEIQSQFIFVREFSKFIIETKEELAFFKRFVFDYDFNAKRLEVSCNEEWFNNHKSKFEVIKQDKKACEEALRDARNWYKEQLNVIDFAAFSEQDKEDLMMEMFVAFGGSSDEKYGGIAGYNKPLEYVLWLGRYYNVQFLPLTYIDAISGKTSDQKKILNLANGTRLRCCGLQVVPPNIIKKATGTSVALEGGQSGRRYDVSLLKTQEPSGKQIEKEDSMAKKRDKVLSNASFSDIAKSGSPVNALKLMGGVIQRAGIPGLIQETKEMVWEILAEKLPVLMSRDSRFIETFLYGNVCSLHMLIFGIGIPTHCSVDKAKEIFKNPEITSQLLQNIAIEGIFSPKK